MNAQGQFLEHRNVGLRRKVRSGAWARAARAALALLVSVPAYRAVPAAARIDDLTLQPKCVYSGLSAADPAKALCISKENFARDVCGVIDHYATVNDLPSAFFARLIWRESLFRPNAVSPKGAEGIAQFMPGTAKMRGSTTASMPSRRSASPRNT